MAEKLAGKPYSHYVKEALYNIKCIYLLGKMVGAQELANKVLNCKSKKLKKQ